MTKKTILKEINSNIYYNIEAWENIYRGKTFAVVTTFNNRVKGYYKTKRGAEGFVKRESNYSYYDEMTNNEVNCGSGLEVIEILESDLLNYKENKTIWFKAFLNAIGDEWCVRRVKGLADSNEVSEEIKEYVEVSFNELKEANFFGGLTVLENKELLTEKLEELKEDLKDYLESDNQNSKTITFIKEEIERIENKIKALDPNFKIEEAVEQKEIDIITNNTEIEINFNEEKNGIEISFLSKPEKEILDQLKINGFRWHRVKKFWFTKDTEERRKFLKSLIPAKAEGIREVEEIENNIEVAESIEESEKLKNEGIKPTKETIGIIDTLKENIFIRCLSPALNKNDKKEINDKRIKEKSYSLKAQIVEIIKMSKDQYTYFKNNLMDNYDFLSDKGGWQLDDNGKYLHHTLIALVCEGEEILILDPSGHDYVRYLNKLIEGEELILCCLNSLGSNYAIQKKEPRKTISRYEKALNSILECDLYQLEFSSSEILKDDRIIKCNSLNDVSLVTGLALKEFIKEGYPVDLLNLEKYKFNEDIDVLTEQLYKEDNKLIFSLFPTDEEIEMSKISMLERLEKELNRTKVAA